MRLDKEWINIGSREMSASARLAFSSNNSSPSVSWYEANAVKWDAGPRWENLLHIGAFSMCLLLIMQSYMNALI